MKKNDSGDFSVLYVESDDERTPVFQMIAEQKKPVVIMLAEQTLAFQRPDDFSSLKRIKRQLDLPIVFVIPLGGQLAQMAARNGFPVYLSMDALADALSIGQLTRSRPGRATNPLSQRPPGKKENTAPLAQRPPASKEDIAQLAPRAPQPRPTVQLQHEKLDPIVPAYNPAAFARTNPLSQEREAESWQAMISGALDQKNTAQLQVDEIEKPDVHVHVHRQITGTGMLQHRSSPHQTGERNGIYGHGAPASLRRGRVSSPLSRDLARRRTDPLAQPPRLSVPLAGQIAPPPMPRLPIQEPRKRARRFSPLLVVLIIALVIGIAGAFLVLPHSFQTDTPSAAPSIVGSLAFSNSEHLSENSTQGIGDQVTIDFNGIAAPTANKSYYAWLLGDQKQSDPKALLLGKLTVSNSKAHLFYGGDSQHTNLLQTMSRFLVTEEDAQVQPLNPSPDQSVWCFSGEFSSAPLPSTDGKQFSYLDHLRHLLASDPTLNELELPGGLNNWFYRNTGKVLEWTGSIREAWEEGKDTGFLRRQLMRTLEYLDGISFVSQDLPPNTPLLVNERLARIGLIQVNGPNQEPPSYMSHIIHHLNGLLQAGNATNDLRKKIAPLVTALANVEHWLGLARTTAQKLLKMTDAQLKQQPETLNLINDLIDNTNQAYTGEMDPITNQMREGATWVHRQMQALATLSITTVAPTTNQAPQMSGNTDRASTNSPDGSLLAGF